MTIRVGAGEARGLGVARVVDFAGGLQREFNYRDELGLLHVAAVTTGPRPGTFAALDVLNHEIVVFGLCCDAFPESVAP